jgi:catechol 2,3-dioxygenase-like lactoylglutathione lyase family enzyme
MKPLAVHHVSINVVDLDAALEFYVGKLGLDPLPRPDFGFPGAWLAAGGQQVHLIQTGEAHVSRGEHFALQVGNIEQACSELRARGLEVSDPMDLPPAGRQAFLRDPSGNVVELNEPSSTLNSRT